MEYVEILATEESAFDALDIRTELGNSGIESTIGLEELAPDLPTATVAIFTKDPRRLFFLTGFRAGQKVPVIAIQGAEALDLPSIGAIDVLDFSDPNLKEKLLQLLRARVDLGSVTPERPQDPEELAHWVSSDWKRLDDLDSDGLADLLGVMLRRSGFATNRSERAEAVDIFARLPDLDMGLAIECKARASGHLMGIGEIRHAYTLCSAHRSNFIIIVSNSSFTKAAHAWASCAVPAVHLMDGTSLRKALEEYLTVRTTKRGKGLSSWTSHILNLRKGVQPTGNTGLKETWLVPAFEPTPQSTPEKPLFKLDLCIVVGDELEKEQARVNDLEHRLHDVSWTFKVLSTEESKVDSWRKALNSSRYILFIPSSAGGRPLWRDRHLQLIAHWCGQSLRPAEQYFVVAQDNPINRLSMPTCLRNPVFLEPDTEDLVGAIRRRAQTKRAFGEADDS